MKPHVEVLAGGDPSTFQVTVHEGGGRTTHEVTLREETYERLAADGQSPGELVKASFHFLLDREPKEAILRRFDLTVISHYFPDFESRIGSYLKQED